MPARGQTLEIRGRNWEQVRALRKFAAGTAAYDDLPAVYASARLALDDTQGPTLRYDAVNARVFDALAAGTLVLTNCAGGVRELFDDEFPVWDSPESLRAERDALLADDERRDLLAARYREMVLTRHTYEHRAHELVRRSCASTRSARRSASRSERPTGSRPSAGATCTSPAPSRVRCSAAAIAA